MPASETAPAFALGRAHRFHFVGIGGAGMCAIAELLLGAGFRVSGSDLVDSPALARLRRLGVLVRLGHAAEAVAGADAVVASSAIPPANVELRQARENGVPVVARGEMLAELMRQRRGIAVAGSHGKTTTAAMLASIFVAAGQDPSFAVGGVVDTGGGARLGAGRHFIAEADESDASFLLLRPELAVVTSVDPDHLDAYGQSVQALAAAFERFVAQLPFHGAVAVCADDVGAASLIERAERRVLGYGFTPAAAWRGHSVRANAAGSEFAVSRPEAGDLEARVPMPGCHNVQNALGAIAIAAEAGIDDAAMVAGLASFRGVERRFRSDDCSVAGRRFTLVDDYGHHPTEVARMIDAVRGLWPGRRLVMVYQPHRYTRTRDLRDAFAAVLARVDALVLAEVYGAGEAPIEGADAASLGRAVVSRGLAPDLVRTPEEALERVRELVAEGDVVVVQGAGDIDRVAAALRPGGAA